MKIKFLILAFAAVMASSLTGCVNEKEMVDDSSVPSFTIRAAIPEEPLTKAGFTVPSSGKGLHVAWKAGDNIRVISGANSAVYSIQAGFTDHVAHFTGAAVSGNNFDIVCPGSYASVAAAEAGNLTLTQSGNGNTDHLVFTAMLGNVPKAKLGDIVFSDGWAAENAGVTFKRGGIVKFVLTLPGDIKAPEKVTLTGIGNEISVNLTGVSLTSQHVLTAYAQSGWDDVAVPAWTSFTVSVMDSDGTCFSSTKTLNAAATLKAGMQNIITVSDGFTKALFAGGDGTQAHPYLIANAEQLDNMHADGILKHQERVYFRLIKDIDLESYLSSHTWIPVNWESPYDYIIDFDGGNHTIDHFKCTYDATSDEYNKPSFFGLLYGSCYDVKFANAFIETNSGTAGVLGGYVGYGGKKAVVYNVHVQGIINRTKSDGDSGIGGLAGRISFAYIDSCSADVEINCTVKDFVGGLFGLDWSDASRIRNCWTTGVIHGSQKVGGICGGLIRPETQIINCYSTLTLDAMRLCGGIAGNAVLDNNTVGAYATILPDDVFKGCIAWQPSITVRDNSGHNDKWASGAIVGYTATHNYLINCKRRSDMVFTDFSDELVLYDQNDANPDNPLVINNPNSSTYKHLAPYHGKAYSGTLSACAKSLGWDETVWDLSGAMPVLTGAVEAESSEEAPVSGDSKVPAGNDISRNFPTNGSGNWTVTEVEDGITFYHYYGICDFSWMDSGTQYQEVYVVDYDLSNTDYEVKLVYSNPSATCSEVFEKTGAVAAINAGYEKPSIALKTNSFLDTENNKFISYPSGYPVSFLPNNYITDNNNIQVVNWKNEGAFYTDGKQGVRIAFDSFVSGTATDHGADTKVKTAHEIRPFYKSVTDDEPAFVSSSPVLISNYVQYGRSFRSRYPKQTNSSEEPYTHQGGTYPRTAVALAYPPSGGEHLLLIVCDGRYAASTKRGYGMSALWLTRFIAEYFGPKYMLNLDGGGSSTMCVRLDEYDMDDYVANYPCDNYSDGNKIDHAGQRARDSFIVIVPAE